MRSVRHDIGVVRCGTDPETVAYEQLGRKAYELLGLYRLRRLGGFEVPDFWVVTAEASRQFHEQFGPVVGGPLPGRPAPDRVPPEAVRFYREFPRHAAPAIQHCLDRRAGRAAPVLRTSMVIPPGRCESGVNSTRRPDDHCDLIGGTTIPSLLAGMYKPYTDWCLGEIGRPHRTRVASLVLMERITTLLLGTAYLREGTLLVEVDDRCAERLGLRLPGEPIEWDGQGGPAVDGLGPALRRLRHACLQVADALRAGTAEVEFCFDDREALYLVQARALATGRAPTARGLVQSSGAVSGPVVDLRDAPRSTPVEGPGLAGALVLVRAEAPAALDAFALGWALAVGDARPPAAILLTHDRPCFRNHLAHALRERLPGTFIGQVLVPQADALARMGHAEITADGVRLHARPRPLATPGRAARAAR